MNLLSTEQEIGAGRETVLYRGASGNPWRRGPEFEPALTTLEAVAAPVCAVDLTGGIRFANRALLRLLGYESAREITCNSLHLLAHRPQGDRGDHVAVDCPMERAIRNGESARFPNEVLWRADGSKIQVELSCEPLVQREELIGSVVTILDLTTDRSMEKELGKLGALIDSSEDLIGMASSDLKITFLNQGGAKMAGLANPSDALGRDVREFLTPEACQTLLREAWPEVEAGRHWKGELQLLTPSGAVVDVLANSFLVKQPDGEVLGQATIMRDITLRKKIERARQMLASLVESSSDFIGVASADGTLTYLNEGGARLVGLDKPSDATGSPISTFHPDQAWAKIQAEVIPAAARDGHWRGETQLRNFKTGEILDVILSAFLVQTPDGNGSFSMGAVMHDISERKRAEDSLRQAKETAEAANRLKSEFLANMSHEIRTPMNGIMGMTDLALETELTGEQRDYLQTAKECASNLLKIINDILDFSKIEAGKMELDPIDFDLRKMLKEITSLMTPSARDKGLELSCDVAPEIPRMLRGDPVRLEQIIVNLLGNAVKFTKRGEVALSIRMDPEAAGSGNAGSGNSDEVRLRADVRDTGIGIPAGKQRTIFEAFTQADGSMTRKFGGTGLGLTISNRLVQMMQGKIWVDSVPGLGSTFHFTVLLRAARQGR